MLYTIGDYEKDIIKQIKLGKIKKIGSINDCNCVDFDYSYTGGIVFKSMHDANTYIINTRFTNEIIYGLDTTLDNTYLHTDGNLYLINSCNMIYLA